MSTSVTDVPRRPRAAKRRDGDVVRCYRYPLHPTPEQAETMLRWFDGCRWLWNQAVEHHSKRWAAGGRHESFEDMATAIPAARAFPGSPLGGVPGTWAQGTLRQLEEGWKLFWGDRKAGKSARPPGFKSRFGPGAVRFAVQEKSQPATPEFLVRTMDTGSVRFSQVRIVKVGWVVARIDRPLPVDALCGSMVVQQDQLGRWWVIFQCDVPAPEKVATGSICGVDRGVEYSVMTDDGRQLRMPGMTQGEARRRLKLEKKMARSQRMNPCPSDSWSAGKRVLGECQCERGGCWKQSGRYAVSKRGAAKIRDRETQRRSDAAHKASTVLADGADVVVFEKLQYERMTKSASGTKAAPGVKVAQKRGLNRSISSQGWGKVQRLTAYKARVVEVDPAYSSQTCAECGHVDRASRKSQSLFVCTACGHTDNADRNAARVVRQRGIDLLTSEQSGSAATQAVAGRGGDRIQRPEEPSTLPVEVCSDGLEGELASLVPPSWGVSVHRFEIRRRRRRRRPRAGRSAGSDAGVGRCELSNASTLCQGGVEGRGDGRHRTQVQNVIPVDPHLASDQRLVDATVVGRFVQDKLFYD